MPESQNATKVPGGGECDFRSPEKPRNVGGFKCDQEKINTERVLACGMLQRVM